MEILVPAGRVTSANFRCGVSFVPVCRRCHGFGETYYSWDALLLHPPTNLRSRGPSWFVFRTYTSRARVMSVSSPTVLARSVFHPLRPGDERRIGKVVELINVQDHSVLWEKRKFAEELLGYSLLLAAVPIVPSLPGFELSNAFYLLALALWSVYAGGCQRYRDNITQPIQMCLHGVLDPCSMLGIRDAAGPGLFTALMLRFDRPKVKPGLSAAAGKKNVVEERWTQFFIDPSQWWDHRLGKTSARYPDFKHKKTGEALWVYDNSNPDWVKVELAAMAPGTVELPVVFWNKKLARYVREGQDVKALELFQQMREEGRNPDTFTFVPVLKACGNLQDLEEGRRFHTLIKETGLELDLFVGTSLVDMYAKCGSTEEARSVFNKMPARDAVNWTAMVTGYVKCDEAHKALQLYDMMREARVEPVPATFVGVLNACANLGALKRGKQVHAQIIRSGCELDPFVSSSLVDMYAKCGSIDEAHGVFEKTGTDNVASWTALIMGYVKCGQARKALEQYRLMELEQVEPVPLTFVGVLNACASVGTLVEGRRIHEQIVQSGCLSDVFVSTSLVDMYAKCGSMEEAESVFDEIENGNVASWNAMLSGYVKCGLPRKAVELYRQMLAAGVEPAPTTFAVVLNACTSLGSLDEGRRVHEEVIQNDCLSDVFVGTSLVDMYAKCGSIDDAWIVFNQMPSWDVAAWTAMIMGYVYKGQCQNALALYYQMELEGVESAPDTFVKVLQASCATQGECAMSEEGCEVS
ncbi:unnamed protein product [Calypogeia fissa]